MGIGHEVLDFGRLFRAAALRLRKDELPGERPQNSEHLFVLFIPHCAENNPDTLRVRFLEEIGQSMRSGNIMRTIQKKSSDSLETARPYCRVYAPNDVLS